MYEVVVVEDEERILRNICRRMERVSPLFRAAAQFTNPLLALDYLREHPADVVFTDIRMPEMDGLTLLSQLEAFQSPLTVIVSSYQDFSYAQSAIRLRVSDYLLKPFLDEELLALLERLAKELERRPRPKPPAPDAKTRLAESIRDYLDGHLCETIGLGDLAGHFGFSQTYLLRVFREAFGTSPIDYLIAAKIERAKELLRGEPGLTVREVAERTGYSNQYYFSNAFKHATGVSPAEYRRKPG